MRQTGEWRTVGGIKRWVKHTAVPLDPDTVAQMAAYAEQRRREQDRIFSRAQTQARTRLVAMHADLYHELVRQEGTQGRARTRLVAMHRDTYRALYAEAKADGLG